VEPWSDAEKFAEVSRRAERNLRKKKDRQAQAAWFPSHPLFRLCELCGQRPAESRVMNPGEEHELVCEACRVKSTQRPLAFDSSLCSAAKTVIEEQGTPNVSVELPEDLGAIPRRVRKSEGPEAPLTSREAGDSGYIGFIYADGNGLGEMWEAFTGNEKAYQGRCGAISRATSEALQEALVSELGAQFRAERRIWEKLGSQSEWYLPCRPLIVGGDDVVLVTAAEWALPVAAAFCRGFQALLMGDDAAAWQATERVPGMSAGVVLSGPSFPIQQSFELAKALCRKAKQRIREGNYPQDPGALDFAVVTAAVARDLEGQRRQDFRPNSSVNLTERPYLVEPPDGHHLGIACLLDAVAAARTARKEIPRSKLKDLPSVLRDHPRSEDDYLEFRYHLSSEQREAWAQVESALKLEGTQTGLRDLGGTWCSGLLDLVEILDVVPG
jgi:hypothetical protein